MRLKSLRILAVLLILAFIPGSTNDVGSSSALRRPRTVFRHIPLSLFDSALVAERKASVGWEGRTGPERRVVDVVCLVPDLPTFLAAIATWDGANQFPILIDDPEYTYKFLRAFRPARLVRYAGPVRRLLRSMCGTTRFRPSPRVGGSDAKEDEIPAGDRVPRQFGPTPPGVVVSSPSSPMLAGAVALAAGRFEPLLRWEPEKRFGDLLSEGEADQLAHDLEGQIADRTGGGDTLGDDCDFITLAATGLTGTRPPKAQTHSMICWAGLISHHVGEPTPGG